MKNDPILDRIRNVRRHISERFNHDPKKVVEHYKEIEKQRQATAHTGLTPIKHGKRKIDGGRKATMLVS